MYRITLAALLIAIPTTLLADEPPARPVPLIFDTDIGNDCDDVLALAVIHSLQSRGECELLAVTITKDHDLAAPFTDAVNTFYGRGDIPIGVCHSGVTDHQGKYNGLASEKDGDGLRYPHDLTSGSTAPDAVSLLRKTLASQDDHSVVIAQVGFSTNLANLLASSPDDHSPLNGRELVSKKVRLLSIMAAAFAPIPDRPADDQGRYREYNVFKDIPSARKLADAWPTDIVWSGFEIGINLKYPHESIDWDYAYVDHHPVAEAYLLYQPRPHDRPTWDLTSVLHAVRPNYDYFDLSPAGRVVIDENGYSTFTPTEDGRDRYLILRDELQKARTKETLVQLSSQPPSK